MLPVYNSDPQVDTGEAVLIIAQAETVLDILTEKVLWACLALKRMHFTQEIKHTILLGRVNVEKLVSDHPYPSPYY